MSIVYGIVCVSMVQTSQLQDSLGWIRTVYRGYGMCLYAKGIPYSVDPTEGHWVHFRETYPIDGAHQIFNIYIYTAGSLCLYLYESDDPPFVFDSVKYLYISVLTVGLLKCVTYKYCTK